MPMQVTGLDEYTKAIGKLGNSTTRIVKMAVYDGADVVADAVRRAVSALTSVPDITGLTAWQKRTAARITEAQKDGLLEGLILTKMNEEQGFIGTVLTFVGYNRTKTQKYPQGQPNAMIAASVESGTSAHQKQPFMRKTVNMVKAQAEAAMQRTADAEIKKIMGG